MYVTRSRRAAHAPLLGTADHVPAVAVRAADHGGATFGAKLISADFTLNALREPAAAGDFRWSGIWTPYTVGARNPNVPGTVETQSVDRLGRKLTINARRRRVARSAGPSGPCGERRADRERQRRRERDRPAPARQVRLRPQAGRDRADGRRRLVRQDVQADEGRRLTRAPGDGPGPDANCEARFGSLGSSASRRTSPASRPSATASSVPVAESCAGGAPRGPRRRLRPRPLVPRAGVVARVVAGPAQRLGGHRGAAAGVAVDDDLGALGEADALPHLIPRRPEQLGELEVTGALDVDPAGDRTGSRPRRSTPPPPSVRRSARPRRGAPSAPRGSRPRPNYPSPGHACGAACPGR